MTIGRAVVSFESKDLLDVSQGKHSPDMLVPRSPTVVNREPTRHALESRIDDSLNDFSKIDSNLQGRSDVADRGGLNANTRPELYLSANDTETKAALKAENEQHIEIDRSNVGKVNKHSVSPQRAHSNGDRDGTADLQPRRGVVAVMVEARANERSLDQKPGDPEHVSLLLSSAAVADDRCAAASHKLQTSEHHRVNESQSTALHTKLRAVPRSALEKLRNKRQGLVENGQRFALSQLREPQGSRNRNGQAYFRSKELAATKSHKLENSATSKPKSSTNNKNAARKAENTSKTTIKPEKPRETAQDSLPVASRLRSKQTLQNISKATAALKMANIDLSQPQVQVHKNHNGRTVRDTDNAELAPSLSAHGSLKTAPRQVSEERSLEVRNDPYALPAPSPPTKDRNQPRQLELVINDVSELDRYTHRRPEIGLNMSPPSEPLPASVAGEVPKSPALEHTRVRAGDDSELPRRQVTPSTAISRGQNLSPSGKHLPASPLTHKVVISRQGLGAFSTHELSLEPQAILTTAARGTEAPGTSKQDAIAISDNESSSDGGEETHLEACRVDALPIMSGSQPLQTTGTRYSQDTARSLPGRDADVDRDIELARKATIISFGKSGPRNQGSNSGRRAAKGPEPTISSIKVPLFTRQSSVGLRSEVRRHSGGPSSAAASIKTTRSTHSSYTSNVAGSVGDALSSMLKRPAMELPEPQPAPKRQKQHCASKLELAKDGRDETVMRSSTASRIPDTAYDDDEYQPNDDFDESTLLDLSGPIKKLSAQSRTASQLAMPPPCNPSEKAARARALHLRTDIATPITSRILNKTASSATPASRARPSENPIHAPELTHDAATERSVLWDRDHTVPAKSKTSDGQQHALRNVSQTVDLGGSPIPQDMVVSPQRTVLEAFSLESAMSSEGSDLGRVLDDTTLIGGLTDPQAVGKIVMKPYSPTKPLPRPRLVSSIKQSIPAPLLAERDISRIVKSKPEPRGLNTKTPGAVPCADPFRNLGSPRKKVKNPANFGSITKDLSDQIGRLKDHMGPSHSYAGTTEPPGSLDNDIDVVVEQKNSTKKVLAAGISAVAQVPSIDCTNLDIWRNALKPHQLNLFDELRNIAHRVTQHLVDEEVATANMLEDYRRRGVTIIEKMEERQVHLYKQIQASLCQRRGQAKKELQNYADTVDDCEKASRVARAEHDRKMEVRAQTNRDLEALIAQMS